MASTGDTLSPHAADVDAAGVVHEHHRSRSRSRSFSRRRSVSAAGTVDVPMVPAVDLGPLIIGATAPAAEAADHADDAPPSPRAGTTEAAAAGGAHAVAMSTEYLQYLEALAAVWKDCPAIEVAFDQLTFSIRNEATIADAAQAARRARRGSGQDAELAVGGRPAATKAPSASEENTPDLAKAVVQMALAPVRLGQAAFRAATGVKPDQAEVLRALEPASGIIKPNSMTLVLAPPGAGKSILLRALSGRLNHDSGLTGSLTYNGLTAAECSARGIHVTRLCSYVGQNDIQFPVLSVEETLEFAKQNGVADVELLSPDDKLRAMDARRTELLMEMLGLTECRITPIGSDLMRGVSGGQRKRSQIGETLMSNARLYCLDEVSNGLDSAVTLHIFSALKQACAVNQSSVVTALQQVTPETYALFDQVILMQDGHVLYHGPREQVRDWLRDVCHIPFIPDSLEEAGFLVDLLSDPKQAMDKAALAHKVALAQAQEPGRRPSPTPSLNAASVSDLAPSASAPVLATPSAVENESKQQEGVAEAPLGVVRFHVDSSDEPAETQRLAVPSTRVGSVVSSSSSGANPFKLSPATLASVTDLDLLLAANERSVYTQKRRELVAQAVASRADLAARAMNVASWSAYTQSQYGREFPHSTLRHTALCCERQVKLIGRNLTMVVPRIFNAILMGFVYGTLFFQLQQSDFSSRLGIIQNAVMFMAFANFQELPVAAEGKQVVVRQINAGFYPSFSYTAAVNLLTLPLAAIEAITFGLLVYFVPSFQNDAGRFFFFLFLLLSVSSAMSQTFRTITYLASNADVAQQMNMPFVMLFVVYGGFLIPRTAIQNWLISYYISPFSWGTSALGLNEFSAGVYGDIDSNGVRTGDAYLDAFGLRTEKIWQWAAVAYLWGFYLVLSSVSAILLAYSAPTNPMGTKRVARSSSSKAAALKAVADEENERAAQQQVRIEVTAPNGAAYATNGDVEMAPMGAQPKRLGGGALSSAKASFQLSSMPFTPATLSWRDLKYTVFVGKDKTPRVLLNQISGYAEPGKLIALMGSSGAGKTTLMDVIAGRKTTGIIEHEHNIFVNGQPKDPQTFASITGYVEQTDIHNGMATVKEALEFSAKLRLPASVSDATRNTFIAEVMELVGLASIQNRMIGDASQPSLSTGQLKLLTIAVELVANPAIIFLDEPTSGLDSKSAFRVMSAVRRIAATGRTIVCTIHQPSQEVFFMFDRLLLLRRGGEVTYFDEIGVQGDKLVNYLTKASRNLMPYSPLNSPANWMLDVMGLDATQLVEEQRAAEEEKAEEEAAHPGAKPDAAPLSVVITPADASAAASQPAAVNDGVQQAFKAKVLLASKSSANAGRLDALAANAAAANAEPIQFSEVWKASPEAAEAKVILDRLCTPFVHAEGGSLNAAADVEYVNDFTRLVWVVRRAYVSHWRSPPVNVTRCLLMTIIGIFLGVVYFNLRVRDFAGMSSLLAAVFLGVSLPSSVCSNASLSTFFRQRAVYYRESSVKMYGYKIYTATMTLVEMPYLLVGLLCFLLPFYFMVGLSNDAGLFFQFLLASYLMVLFFSFLEQVFIASLPNIIAAQALNGLAMSMLFAFGGLYIKASAIPVGWQWFYYMDPIPKSFIATMLTQVHCSSPAPIGSDTDARIDGCLMIEVPGEGQKQLYDYVRTLLESSHDAYWPMIGWLFLTLGVVRIFSVYLFKKVSHIER